MCALPILASLPLGLELWRFAPSAPPPQIEVNWEAPAGCPSGEDVRRILERTLGSSDVRRPVLARVSVSETASGFELDLTLTEGESHSERSLRGPSCEELSNAAALIVAMAVAPRIRGLAPESSPPDPSPSEPPPAKIPNPAPPRTARPSEPELGSDIAEIWQTKPARPVAASPETKPEDSSATSLRFVGRARAGFGWGPLPRGTAHIDLGVGVGSELWRVEATANYWTPREGNDSPDPDRKVVAQLWALGARGCAEPSLGRFSVPLCGGLEAGQMIARGGGNLDSRRATSAWVAATFGMSGIFWATRRLGLSLGVSGHAPLRRPQFDTEPSGDVIHGANPLGVSVLAGFNVRTP